MSYKGLDRNLRFTGALTLPLCLLSACAGDGSYGVASNPPPPTPPPMPTPAPTPTPTPTLTPTFIVEQSVLDSPATRKGSYDVIGRLSLTRVNGSSSSRLVEPHEFTMNSTKYFDDDPFQYTLSGPAGTFPAGVTSISVGQAYQSWDFNLPSAMSRSFSNEPLGSWCCQYLGDHLTVSSKAVDGTETQILSSDMTQASSAPFSFTTNNVTANLVYDTGYSYVAMGEWAWGAVGDVSGTLLFVEGNQTPPAGIPASGTATYDARTLALASGNSTLAIAFSLTADFGKRTMSTSIDQDYRYLPNADSMDFYPGLGLHVSGSAPFNSSGTFDIPLSGTANYSLGYPTNPATTPPPQAVTGIMNGAFFGPNAEQVGGVFAISGSGGAMQLQDAFVGQQHHP